MKYFVILLGVLIMAGVANADPRMVAEPGDKYAHFLRNAANANDEIDVVDYNLIVNVNPDGNGGADGVANVTVKYANSKLVGEMLGMVFEPYKKFGTIKVTSEQNATPCTMIRRNGQTYVSNNWESEIKALSSDVTYILRCRDGVAE